MSRHDSGELLYQLSLQLDRQHREAMEAAERLHGRLDDIHRELGAIREERLGIPGLTANEAADIAAIETELAGALEVGSVVMSQDASGTVSVAKRQE